MNFNCNRTKLHEAVNNVSKAVPSKSNMAALEGIKLSLSNNTLELTGYDLELGIKTTLEVNSSDKGELIVNARLFNEILRKMSSDEVTINIDEKLNITISGNATTYNISAIPATEYPDFPSITNEEPIEIPQYILRNMIDHTKHAVATNENKPILTGQLFDIEDGLFRMVAIDGFRLAVRNERITASDKLNFVVPSKALSEISKILSKNDPIQSNPENQESKADKPELLCKIYKDLKHITFEISGYYVVSRLLTGEFHNYKASIPENFTTEVVIKTKEFTDSIDRCSLLINEQTKCPIKCTFENNSLKVNCKTSIGKVDDVIEAEVNGDPIEIGLNSRFLLDALKACDTDKIRIQLQAPNRPVKILPMIGDSFVFLLMPIQLKN
ncbi:MAG: DNA polymerase III subunit beta [Oscillospiraceae bacterium]|nr:DNA polymerase III subunit beta [Oscillospiraceae bacterium]